MADSIPFLDVGASYRALKAEIDQAVARVLASGWYLLGKELEAFEQEYALFTGAAHCVGVANGLEALVLALKAMEVGPGHEVIVPSNTYIATWLAVSAVGATPVPVEPRRGTWGMDPARIADCITPRTRVILPVHLYGHPVDLDPILSLAQDHGLLVLEDAAQAHGATYKGRRIGGHGTMVAWSFYPGKNLGCFGDGGAVTTQDEALAERVRVLRNYGSRVKYHNEVKGHNSRLDELQAAVLRVKLAHLASWNAHRQLVAKSYQASLASIPGLELPEVPDDRSSAWHLYVVDLADRDAVQRNLKEMGVETLIHYPVPPHLSEAYARDRDWGELPLAESAAQTHLSLPMGPHMPIEQIGRITECLATAIRRAAHA